MEFCKRSIYCTLAVLTTLGFEAVVMLAWPEAVCLRDWAAPEWNALAAVLQLPLQILILVLTLGQSRSAAVAEDSEDRKTRVQQALAFVDDPALREAGQTLDRVFANERTVPAQKLRDELVKNPALAYLFDRLDSLAYRVLAGIACPEVAFGLLGEFAIVHGRRYLWFLKAERSTDPAKYRYLRRVYREWIPRVRS